MKQEPGNENLATIPACRDGRPFGRGHLVRSMGNGHGQAPVPVPGQPGQPMGMRPGGMMPEKPEGSGEYVTSYALVLAGVGLGLLLVCRTSNRRDRARPEQYEESKVTATD